MSNSQFAIEGRNHVFVEVKSSKRENEKNPILKKEEFDPENISHKDLSQFRYPISEHEQAFIAIIDEESIKKMENINFEYEEIENLYLNVLRVTKQSEMPEFKTEAEYEYYCMLYLQSADIYNRATMFAASAVSITPTRCT